LTRDVSGPPLPRQSAAEEVIRRLEAIKTEAAQFDSQKTPVATPEQKARILALAA
jgi:hypothetical protein